MYVLELLEKAHLLLAGKYPDIHASGMEANAALKSMVRRDTGESCEAMLTGLAEAGGIPKPTRAKLVAFDRRRKGEENLGQNRQSTTDEESRIAKLEDGRTHMAYKPEHVIDLESGAIVSATVHPADQRATGPLPITLLDAQAEPGVVRAADEPGTPAGLALPPDRTRLFVASVRFLDKKQWVGMN